MTKNKIKDRAELKRIVNRLKKNRKKIVFTNGCFDLLHCGHVELLEKARSLGDILIVAVNSDGSVKRLKGPERPLNVLRDRMHVLSSLEAVDYVTSFSETDPANIIKELRPDVLVKGGDWKINQIVGKDILDSYGGEVKTVPYLKGRSTDSLIQKICKTYKK